MSRPRQSYNLNRVAEGLHDQASVTQDHLEDGLALLVASLADDGRIDADEASQIAVAMTSASGSNQRLLTVVTVLDSSGADAACRVVEAQQLRQRMVQAR